MDFYTFLPKILNMSLTASVAIVFVLLLRLLLKKAPKVISYALWGVVLIRLLCPVSIESGLSLFGLFDTPTASMTDRTSAVEYIPSNIVHTEYPEVVLPVPGVGEAITEVLPQGEEQLRADPLEAPVSISTYIWAAVVLVMAFYGFVTYLRLRRRLVTASLLRDNIYLADDIDSPFVMGLIRPKIYLPSAMEEREQSYIILHEQHHIRRLDHIVKALAFVALCIHWFNPLVWVAFILSGKDMEMSCDEAVVRKLGTEIRADYSASLLSLATGKRIIAGMPLAFGEGNTKGRIKNLANWKKPAFWVVLVAVVACMVLAVCLLTNPKALGDSITLIKQSTPVRGNAFTYDVSFGQNVMSGTVHAEQWSNGTCVKSSPVVLTNEVDEINILMNVRRENNSPVGVDIQVDTNEYGGSLITYFAFPENNSIIGWGCKGYELNEPVQIHPDTEKILAALVFDVGNGVRAFGTEDLIIEPERLTNADYAIVIRAEFDSTNLDKENHEATPIYSTFSATVLEIQDGYYLVEPVEGSWELSSADRIEVPIRNAVPSPEPEVGDVIEIEYSGEILETYPARVAEVYNIRVATEKQRLSLNDVIILSQKGYDLTWDDFEEFAYTETGSGLYIRVYEINDMFQLMIGGAGPNSEPMYMYLDRAFGANTRIDIRDGGVTEFISEHNIISSTDPLDAAISIAILEHYASDAPDGLVHVESHVLLANEAVSGTPLFGQDNHMKEATVYLLVFHEKYNTYGGNLEAVGGSYVPTVLTFSISESGEYTLKEYWEPRDGSYYVKDIKEKFPGVSADDALNDQAYIEELQAQNLSKAQAYLNSTGSIDLRIAELLNIIQSSPAYSSNPGDYIEAHRAEYDELLSDGGSTLKFCFTEFLAGGQVDLRGHIMASVCKDIMSGMGEALLYADSVVMTGQDWFNAFYANAKELERQYSKEDIEKYYPATWLLLQMINE